MFAVELHHTISKPSSNVETAMVRSKPPPDAQATGPVDAKLSRRKRGRAAAGVEMASAVLALIQQQSDQHQRMFKLTIRIHPGNRMPTITIEEVQNTAPDAKEEHVSPPSNQ